MTDVFSWFQTTPEEETDINPVMMLNGYETEDVVQEWMLYSSGGGYNDPTTGGSTSTGTSGASGVTVVTEIPATTSYPIPPYEFSTMQIDYLTNKGWNTTARTVDPLAAGSYIEYFCSGGISGAALCVGDANVDAWPLHMFSHVMIIDVSGVTIFEDGVTVHKLCDVHIPTTTYRIYRLFDNTIVYTASYQTGETFVYTSDNPLLVAKVFPAYVYGKLYRSGDLITDAYFIDGSLELYNVEPGYGEVLMQGYGELYLDPPLRMQGYGNLLVGDQIVVGTGEVDMVGEGMLYLKGSAGSHGGGTVGWLAAQAYEYDGTIEDGGYTSGQDNDPSLEIPDHPGMYALGFSEIWASAEAYAYVPPEPQWAYTSLNEIFCSGIMITSSPGNVPEADVPIYAKAWDDLDAGATDGQDEDPSLEVPGGGGYALGLSGLWAKGFDDFYSVPGQYKVGMFFSRLQIMEGIRGDHQLKALIDETMVMTDTITATRVLLENISETIEITDTITPIATYVAPFFESMLVQYSISGQITSGGSIPPEVPPNIQPDGTFIDTNNDGTYDVWVLGEGVQIDTNHDTVPDAYVIQLKGNVDTDADGVQDTWVGGIGILDETNVTVDLAGDRIMIDADNDGTPDTWLTGGQYYDTDGDLVDDLYLVDEIVIADTELGEDDYVTAGGMYVDTNDDDVPDTWVWGMIVIKDNTAADDGVTIDTDNDGTVNVTVTGSGTQVDTNNDGTDDTWAILIENNIDTDSDGTPDTWNGGIGYIDETNTTVDLPGNQIQVDTDGDGTPDTWLGGGEYYDTDGDGIDDVYLVDDQIFVDTDGDGNDDTWVTGGGIFVDTDGDGIADDWVYGTIIIEENGLGGSATDTNGDGTTDVYVGSDPYYTDTDGDGVGDTVVIDIVVNVDTDGDGIPDTWVGNGQATIDEDMTVGDDNFVIGGGQWLDTDGDGVDDTFVSDGGVHIDVDGDGVDDTWLTGGIYFDTDEDGQNDTWVTGGGVVTDPDGVGGADTWQTGVAVWVDTNSDGVEDTWIGGDAIIDTNVNVDLPGNQIQIDTNGDGTPDTWIGGGQYYDTDDDGVDDIYLTDGATLVDTNNDGTPDTWAKALGVMVDTNDDGIKDTWVWGSALIDVDGEIVYGGGIPVDTDGDGVDDAYAVPVIVFVDSDGDGIKDTWVTGVAVITDEDTGVIIQPALDSTRRVWVVNLENGAAVQYDDYGFNSFMEEDGTYYGLTEDGIYELSGSTDNGMEINSLVSFAKSDLGSKQRKGITNIYTGATSDGSLLLKITVDGGQSYIYRARSYDASSLKQHRFDTGKGLIGVYHQLELLNEDGDDFDIESIHFEPIATRRKI